MSDRKNISEGILLAVASATAYGVAFSFRSGYASHFGVPPVFLSPSLGAVLQACGVIAIAILMTWNVAVGIWSFVPRGNTAIARSVRKQLIIVLIGTTLAIQAFPGRTWIAILAVVAFLAFLEFIFPMIVHRNIAGYENKLLAQEGIEKNANKNSLANGISSLIGEDGFRLVWIITLLLLLANLAGARSAKIQTEFYVLVDRPGYVVVSTEENVIILAEYDTKELQLTGIYQVEQLSDSHSWRFKKQTIGSLLSPLQGKT